MPRGVSTSSWCVCQFHHLRTEVNSTSIAKAEIDAEWDWASGCGVVFWCAFAVPEDAMSVAAQGQCKRGDQPGAPFGFGHRTLDSDNLSPSTARGCLVS